VKEIVTKDDVRPASVDKTICFYCDEKIGRPHKLDCVVPQRTVIVRMTIEYPVEVPKYWSKENIEFHRNDGSWCSNNALDELAQLYDQEGGSSPDCMCFIGTKFEYVREAD